MVVNDVPNITSQIRLDLSIIFSSQYNLNKEKCLDFMTYIDDPAGNNFCKSDGTKGTFKYSNNYTPGSLNIVRDSKNKPLMGVFNFDQKHTIRLFRILELTKFRPQINGIKVYANTELPMHLDLNHGEIGRNFPIYSIMLTGKKSMVFFSNKADGSRLVSIPSLSEFVMFPTQMIHGALTFEEDLDILQIQLNSIY